MKSKKTKVPKAVFSDAVALGLDVLAKKVTLNAAAEALAVKHNLPPLTASSYVGCYRDMRTGRTVKRTVSEEGARYMLERIGELGPACLLAALESLWKHIIYRDMPQPKMRALHKEFAERLSTDAAFDEISEELARQVEESLKDTAEARVERLKNAPAKPEQMVAMTRVFRRNPDVIAQVLWRANGVCEGCERPAPFSRPDGRPFLEVHHKQRLADQGDDVPENALALCPNCHRERHHGAVYAQDQD